MNLKKLGKRLRAARENVPLDRGELADMADVHYNTIQRLELAQLKRPTVEPVVKLARVLKLDLTKLLAGL